MIRLIAKIPYFRRLILQFVHQDCGWVDSQTLTDPSQVKQLCEQKEIQDAVLKVATEVQFSTLPNQDKLEFAFSDSTGKKWFRWINEAFMPVGRYDQLQIHLIEIESRISRRSLMGWIDNVSKVLERNNLKKLREDVGHLLGGLKQRLELLHEPELMMRFVSGMHIREDQLHNPEAWNPRLEEEKFRQLMSDQHDHLYDFLKKNSLSNLFPSTNISPKEWNKYLGEAIQEVVKFDTMTEKIGTILNQESSSGETGGDRKKRELESLKN